MTLFFRRTAARARPPVASHPRARARLGAVIAAVALIAAGSAASLAPASAAPSPTPTTGGTTSLTLSPSANGVVRAGQGLTVAVTVDNGTGTGLGATRITVAVGATPLPDRAALAAWLDGTTPVAGLATIGAADLDQVGAGATRTATVAVPGTDPQLAVRAPGVYPLAASFGSGAGTVTSTSVLVVPSDTVSTPTGLVVPITAGGQSTGLLSAAQLTDLTGPTGDLTGQLDAVAGSPALLAVDPALPASIRALGNTAPTSATAWLDRLEALPNARFALQFGDADVSAQLHAGQPVPLQPTSLNAYLRPLDFLGGSAATPSPSPSATAGPTLPALDSLLAVGGTADVFWPATGTAGADVVTALGTQGTRSATTLIASTSTSEGAGGGTVAARGTSGDAPVLVYDAAVSAALRTAARTSDPARRGAPLAAATASLAFATAEANGRPLLVAVDRAADRTAAGLAAAVDAVGAAPGVSLVPVAQLGGTPAAVTVLDAAPDPVRVAAASALLAEEEQLAPLSTVLTDPTQLTGPARAELLQLLGNGWREKPGDWSTALEAHRTSTAGTLTAVSILDPTPVNLAGSGASLGVWVRNDLPYPVSVTLVTSPSDPRLTVQRRTTVTAAANSNTRVKVPVEARVGNGEVTLRLQLESPTGATVGPVRSMPVSVRAEWEGLGIALLSTLVGALVLFGLIRTVLRRRKSRRADASTADASEETVRSE
ncbi:DUF6049 family protein [Microbacterium sp. CJ88]|uniref:DUF6049 family protein n=1 Tax=Microbacterium sp. CJ88 TaxID=3445672 RepID=UPI003F659CB0